MYLPDLSRNSDNKSEAGKARVKFGDEMSADSINSGFSKEQHVQKEIEVSKIPDLS